LKYKELYENLITQRAKTIIVEFEPQKGNYHFLPYHHTNKSDATEKLFDLLIDNFVFLSFDENEILSHHKRNGILNDLKAAARYSVQSGRIPKRLNPKNDGLLGEVLLDLFIEAYQPQCFKLLARAKYKQISDNTEIKGYDSLYFVENKSGLELWLGQAKAGALKTYCQPQIIKDLNTKYIDNYFSKSIFYIADKRFDDKHLCDHSRLETLINDLNTIAFDCAKIDDAKNKEEKQLLDMVVLLKEKQVKVIIPCLLAYDSNLYDNSDYENLILRQIKEIVEDLDISYSISKNLECKILFFLFPIKNMSEIKEKLVRFKGDAYGKNA